LGRVTFSEIGYKVAKSKTFKILKIMKKLFAVLAVSAFLFACNSSSYLMQSNQDSTSTVARLRLQPLILLLQPCNNDSATAAPKTDSAK